MCVFAFFYGYILTSVRRALKKQVIHNGERYERIF